MTTTERLTPEEVRFFQEHGYVGPFTALAPEEMAGRRDEIVALLAETESAAGSWLGAACQCRHLDRRVVFDLCAHPAVIGRMASVYGPDLCLWRSHFFVKDAGAKEIPWHQDANYWPIEPAVNISAWIAIDDATVENACLQVIPGSHRRVLPHVPSGPEMEFPEMADPTLFDATTAVSLEMAAGQFVLFNERTLHHSEPNTSTRRRIGLAVRVTVPFVKVDELFPGHGVVVVSGEDRLGFNHLADPPAT